MQLQGLGKRKRRRSAEERAQVLAAYRASGKTQKQFCLDEGIALPTLTLWLGKSRREPKPAVSRLIEVSMAGVANHAPLEVLLPQSGVIVRVGVGAPASWVGQVIRALRCGD
jgi:transposase-like protein